jgi:hypothetical protein
MHRPIADRPEYAWLREFKEIHGRELLHQYGAHAVGIAWKRTGGEKTDNVALVFYVERKRPEDDQETEPIPPTISFLPSGMDEPVLLMTDVIETPPAEFESEALG